LTNNSASHFQRQQRFVVSFSLHTSNRTNAVQCYGRSWSIPCRAQNQLIYNGNPGFCVTRAGIAKLKITKSRNSESQNHRISESGNLGISESQNVTNSGSQNLGISKNRDLRFSECRNMGILKFRMSETQNLRISASLNIAISKPQNVRNSKFRNLRYV
jgi:hypothetical protein